MEKVGTEKFLADLKAVVESAEGLLRATAGNAGEHVASARERAQETLRTARDRVGEMEEDLLAQARDKAQAADGYVHDNPWRSIGVVAGLAFALGVLMGRRR
jgi:ElaB/YqjD/DUF883 family membrane-anchored ribosome-binding protein